MDIPSVWPKLIDVNFYMVNKTILDEFFHCYVCSNQRKFSFPQYHVLRHVLRILLLHIPGIQLQKYQKCRNNFNLNIALYQNITYVTQLVVKFHTKTNPFSLH